MIVSPVSAASRASSSFQLPGPGAIAVGAARVGGDQQPWRLRVGSLALSVPPAADRLDRERRGVVIGADVDPAGVRRDVVDPVGDGLVQLRVSEVMHVHRHRLTCRPPLAAAVLEVSDELLLLGVHADHWLATVPVPTGLLVEIAELGVAVRVLTALDRLDVGLQAEAFVPQQAGDGVGADAVPGPGQLSCKRAGGLHRPPQRRHRVTPYIRLNQRQQCWQQPRIQIRHSFAAPARTPHPPQRLHTRLKLEHALANRSLTDRSRLGHSPDTAVPQPPGLRSHQQPPLPLVQVWEQHSELRDELITSLVRNAHTTPTSLRTRSNTLIPCKPLGPIPVTCRLVEGAGDGIATGQGPAGAAE